MIDHLNANVSTDHVEYFSNLLEGVDMHSRVFRYRTFRPALPVLDPNKPRDTTKKVGGMVLSYMVRCRVGV